MHCLPGKTFDEVTGYVFWVTYFPMDYATST